MGGSSSKEQPLDVKSKPDLGIVACVLYYPNAVKLIHAPQAVKKCLIDVVNEVNSRLTGPDIVKCKIKQEIPKYYMVSNSWGSSDHQNNAYGMLIIIRLLEEMYKLGYDPVVSSSLDKKDLSTIYFKKVVEERQGRAIWCLTPHHIQDLFLLRAEDRIKGIVRQVVDTSWPKGICKEETEQFGHEKLHYIKLEGNPWFAYTEEECFRSKQLVTRLLGTLAEHKHKLFASINLQGKFDSLFFVEDEGYTIGGQDVCLISLNHADRLRLSGPADLEVLTSNITAVAELSHMRITNQSPVFESWEMTLTGKPWSATRERAVAARMFLSKMFEALISRGWALVNRLDLSQSSLDNKCAMVFVRSVPVICKFACIYVSGKSRLILIDLPLEVTASLALLIRQRYAPGVTYEKQVGLFVYDIELRGLPWISGHGKEEITGEVLHGRALMADILADLSARGWQVVASIDIAAEKDENWDDIYDPHTWFFTYWPADGGQEE